jgi:hypothetical protein
MPLTFYVAQPCELPWPPLAPPCEARSEIPRDEPPHFEIQTKQRPARQPLQRWIDLSA